MSSSLYKIVEVYDEKNDKWRLAWNGKEFEFNCSLSLRDILRHHDLIDVDRAELSDELREILDKREEKDSFAKYYRYHWIEPSELEEIVDKYHEMIMNIPDKSIESDTNNKLNKIMEALNIENKDAEYEMTPDDIKGDLEYLVDTVSGVEGDIAEINLLARLYSDEPYGAKRRIIVYYC